MANNMGDAVIMLDEQGRLINLNQAAQALIQTADGRLIGCTVRQALPDWCDWIEQNWNKQDAHTEMIWEVGETPRYLDVWLTRLCGQDGQGPTYMVAARDNTRARQAEDKLRQVRDELEQRVAERTAALLDTNDCLEREIIAHQQAEDALRREHDLVSHIMETMPAGILLADRQGKFIFANAYAQQRLGLDKDEITQRAYNDPQWRITDYEGNSLSEDQLPLARVIETGEPVLGMRQTIELHNGQRVFLSVNAGPLFDKSGQLDGMIMTLNDVTEQEQAEQALRLYIDQLQILHEIEQGILTAQSPEAIGKAALGRIRQLIPCQRASIMLVDGKASSTALLAVDMSPSSLAGQPPSLRLELAGDTLAALRQGKVAFTGESDRHAALRPSAEEGIRYTVNVPLIYGSELIGVLNLGWANPHAWTLEYRDIARQVADQLAIAIRQAKLHEQVQRHAQELEQRVADRTREISALYDVMAIASESPDLQTALALSLDRVLVAVQSDTGSIYLVGEDQALRLAARQNDGVDPAFPAGPDPLIEKRARRVLEHGQLIVTNGDLDPVPSGPVRGVIVPMRVGGRVLGVLAILRQSAQPPFVNEEITLLSSIADRMGMVVESAHLRQLAEQAAVLEERQRLARDLHDSVTQSIYSLTLLAETGRRVALAGDLDKVAGYLGRLGEVAQQALKEMRLLIYELRPPALEKVGLAGALQQRLDAVEGRAGVQARLLVEEKGQLARPAEEALYRIAIEALNNALKHAAATQVTVRLNVSAGDAEIEIADNGRGFALQAAQETGGMGLTTMRERAEQLGGALTIRSAAGQGTSITVNLKTKLQVER